MSDNGIVWEDPPPSRNGSTARRWEGTLSPLMEHPDRWARVSEHPSQTSASSTAQMLRNRAGVRYPEGRWEFASRSVMNGEGRRYYVYARYLGPEEEA